MTRFEAVALYSKTPISKVRAGLKREMIERSERGAIIPWLLWGQGIIDTRLGGGKR